MEKLLKILESVKLLKRVETYRNDRLSYVVDFGKNKGSYISVFLFNNGIIKKEYIINYGLVEENERLIFEFRNITVNTVHDAKNE